MNNPRMKAWLNRPDGLATQLRAARGALSVRDLAKAIGWPSSSKVTRIENGVTIPSTSEVDEWAAATGASDTERERWQKALAEALSMKSTFKRRTTTAASSEEAPFEDLLMVALFVRQFHPNLVPPLLQTQGYTREVAGDRGIDVILDTNVLFQVKHQQVLEDAGKRFEFVIGESALRYVPGRTEVMAAQLDRLISATDLDNVTLRVVPELKPLKTMPSSAQITLYDGEAVTADALTERQCTGADAARLTAYMDRLAEQAVEGAAARELILAAKAALSIK